MPEFKERKLVTDPQKAFHFTDLQRLKPTRENDPYEYQAGWGNRFVSEVIPGTLPVAQNNPHEVRFGLYTEGITYSAFAAPRHSNFSTYMYRARPAAAHQGYASFETKSNVENCFLSVNPKVETLAEQAEWSPFKLPQEGEKIDFADGLHTLAGSGDPNIKEGLALYVYMFNSSMEGRAFCNTDGDFLISGQLGTLDIKTEMGMIFLQPGEICVIQRGIRFCMNLAPGTDAARGYITEVWGSMWELPDLGPLGGHGLANPRDFLYPVAAIDDDLHVPYQIVNKINGKLVAINQDHSPFDLLAWHGNVVPYKYDLTKFSSQNSTSIDHTDPSIFCVLTAKSRDPVTPLADFLWFGPRWDVATNTFRLPYFHRNSASEFLACLYGKGLGRSDDFQPGGGSFEGSHTPHGGFHEGYQHGMKIQESFPEKILEDQLTIMIESSRLFLWTEYARKGCGTISTHGTDYKVWDALPDRFSANPRAKELLAKLKEDKIAEKKRLAPYYFGGFSSGANTSATEGVHSKELKPYLNGAAETNGTTNGVH
ncbi:Homogentisate 1,2-dioxygenase [Polyplosphaeria fusca]|uniref:homogentisate 1,2-dioxygenase n=1 Tax=Polyplosphaeria fusca TaxID=682080 RepID=A0A9P4QPD5_9PLEO|nr:Homogentisate 1,2-dioxygenase [Polyplosphaeria fusca]